MMAAVLPLRFCCTRSSLGCRCSMRVSSSARMNPSLNSAPSGVSIYLLESATSAPNLTVVDDRTRARCDRQQADVDFRVRTLTEHVLDDAQQGRRRARYGEGFAVELVDKGRRGVQGGEGSREGGGAVLGRFLESVSSFPGQLWPSS